MARQECLRRTNLDRLPLVLTKGWKEQVGDRSRESRLCRVMPSEGMEAKPAQPQTRAKNQGLENWVGLSLPSQLRETEIRESES